MKKTGVLLIQLGTPDSPSTKDVRRYLREFLNDPRVIDIPWLTRKLLVNCIIVPFRAPKSAKIYKELWKYGKGVSPLMTHTKELTKKLNEQFSNDNIEIEFAMRYQNPSMESVLERMKKKNYEQLIILPLFPQYASASTGSALEKAMKIIQKWWVIPEVKIVNQFYDNQGYIDSIVDNAQKYDLKAYDHIIFSYHGLPIRQLDKVYDSGLCEDQPCESAINEHNHSCYKATCYATTRLLADKLNLKEEDYTVAFQSRLNEKWVEPFTDKVVKEWGDKGAKKLLVFSPAFVADCLETIIEIGTEYQDYLTERGGEKVQLVESCNTHPSFVSGIAEIIRGKLKR